jgi:hypothetical protein
MTRLGVSLILIVCSVAVWATLDRLSRIRPSARPAQPFASDDYFSPDYFTARLRFRQSAVQAGGELTALQIDAKGPAGEPLTIDIAWFGSKSPRRALVHSSGIHGVEGFAGSAVQLQVLRHFPRLTDDTAVVLIHAVSPYSMAWLRRVNENNIDLNRNFLESVHDYTGAPRLYENLDSFLNPKGAHRLDPFVPSSVWLMLRHGLRTVRQAVAEGQYEYPAGLFFGGKNLQHGPALVQEWLVKYLRTAGRIVAVDVHTGLGEYGQDLLLAEPEVYGRLRTAFGERVTALDPKTAYQSRGSYPSMIARVFHSKAVYAVTQEFGTYHSIRVLRALRDENQAHGRDSKELTNPAKLALKEAFCPADEAWRSSVLQRGLSMFLQAHEIAVRE